MNKLSRKIEYLFATILMLLFAFSSVFAQELNENCTISVLNRTANVQPDGTWTLPNVPSNMGQVRVRATCTVSGVTSSGQSDFFSPNIVGITQSPPILFDVVEQVPESLEVVSDKLTLMSEGDTAQLTVTATYPDSSTADVTASSEGTTYTISNPAIATVDANGLVTAVASGTVIVSASNEMVLSSIFINVQLTGDSDGDGIPDDFELANGLDPNNPVDALKDPDDDGLTTKEEYDIGTVWNNPDTDGDGIDDGEEVIAGEDGFVTNPLLGDSDGDGVWDGLEVSTGSDPNNSGSLNLADAIDFIEITPSNFVIVFNTIMTEATRQLAVTGTLTDGRTIDLTSSSLGTNYTSSDLTVANFGLTDGLVFAGTDGTAVITATNSGFSADAVVTVQTFEPEALSSVQLPFSAYANNVDIAGSYAYVAGGAGGLFVVDVSNPDSPVIVTSLDTPGTSIDIKISGNNAYIADGASGLRIIDVSAPSIPLELGFIDTPGIAQDLVIRNSLAFVADGASGLQIIDVTNPDNPTIIGSVDTPGTAKGVDVEGNIAAVADGNTVQIIDITDPTNPSILGSVPVSGNVLDLVVRNNFAYVTAYSGRFHVVDFSTPTNPSVVATSNAIVPRDVALSDQFALFAEQLFPNVVPIYNVATPTSPAFVATINFSPLGDYAGTGIALTHEYVYFTSQSFVVTIDYGTTGNTRLFIGQYRNLQDFGTVPPIVSITSPPDGADVVEGSTIQISADATDDVFVASVSFSIDDVVVFTDTSAPYQFNYTVPIGITGFVASATAIDLASNISSSNDVVVNVIPDPLTTVIGRVVDTDGLPVEGATVTTVNDLTSTTTADGTFSIPDVPTVSGNIQVTATATIISDVLRGSSTSVPPVLGGTTDVGEIVISAAIWEDDIGIKISTSDDRNYNRALPFTFPFFGVNYNNVFVNTNGRLTFNWGDNTYSENLNEFYQQPQIAPFFDDLHPGRSSIGMWVNDTLPGKFVVTWPGVRHYSNWGTNYIQVILYDDGRIQFGYKTITGSQGTIVGISPGSSVGATSIDISAETPYSTSGSGAISEYFGNFDLAYWFVTFTPNVSGGYDVTTIPLDTDNDGMPDGFELANGLNPNNPLDAEQDFDGDGLSNLQEFNLGTGVNNSDTDGDSIPDGFEFANGLDPNNPLDAAQDFDGDGLTNLEEYGFGTDLFNPDTDGDGWMDGQEVAGGTDPLVPSAAILVDHFSLSFTGVEGGSGQVTKELEITNIGGDILSWTAFADVPWLTLSLTTGNLEPGSSATIDVTVDTAGFTSGTFTANITVSDPGAFNSPQAVTATLTVFVNTGRGNLLARDIVTADDSLQVELEADPSNQEANFLRSITRLLRIVEQNQDGSDITTFTDSLKEILDRFGFTQVGRSIFDFSTSPPVDAEGHTVLPSDSPTGGDLREFLRNIVLPEISGAIDENLVAIDSFFSLVVTIEEMAGLGISDDTPIEIDYGDVKLLEALLNGLKAAILTSLAYDLDMDVDQANNLGDNLKVQQDIIDANPLLLKLTADGAGLLAQAKSAIIAGINAYIEGSAFIRAEADDQNDDFITIELEDLLEEASLRAVLEEIKSSLSGGAPTVTIMNTLVNISQLFDFPFDLRDFLPPIAFSPERENYIVPGTFPDPTFNGILPGMTQQELADDLDIE